MNNNRYFDIEIDKLTNSIEKRIDGSIYDTEVIPMLATDKKSIRKGDWRFDWHKELLNVDRKVYKLVIINDLSTIQGLMCLEVKADHIYLHLIESASFNCGKNKLYLGIPGNLVAFACKTSFAYGFDGYVAFDAKTSLIKHYQETLYASHFKGTKMFIETPAALRLIKQYFNDINN